MKIHLTAIGGTGMGALAGLLAEAGHDVRGSDGPLYPPMSTQLAELGIPVVEGFRAANLDWGPELVVLGNSCRADHVEYLAAQERGLRVVSFPQLLAERFLADRHPVVVAGTHGKTTTSSLIAVLLREAALEPGYLIGGIPHDLGRGFAVGQPPYFVVEGDEYDCACFDKRPKFVHYDTQTLVLTGVEFDHADIYDDLAQVERAFELLTRELPPRGHVFVAADSPLANKLCKLAPCPVETYAVSPAHEDDLSSTRRLAMPLHWYGTYEPIGGGLQQLVVTHNGDELGSFEVPMTGAHNMANALAAIAVCRRFEVGVDTIRRGLKGFGGVARRQQIRGVVDGVTVIDDFAHHPTAIRETLRGLRNRDGRLIAVFEPRSATSRRKIFQQQFPTALAPADRVYLAPLYAPEKIPAEQRLDVEQVAADLRSMGKEAAVATSGELPTLLGASLEAGDTVVIMSSGSFDGLHERLLETLRKASKA
jgi:UDP-N-acetylmuramate: L-alanyl-gamma-D-glutamyl-meso-diaminopimelate ligase